MNSGCYDRKQKDILHYSSSELMGDVLRVVTVDGMAITGITVSARLCYNYGITPILNAGGLE